jgi:hypothetical protein
MSWYLPQNNGQVKTKDFRQNLLNHQDTKDTKRGKKRKNFQELFKILSFDVLGALGVLVVQKGFFYRSAVKSTMVRDMGSRLVVPKTLEGVVAKTA